ncbi:glycosyltransferase [Bifidobacterium sp. UTCIF-37]|uniref:DUF4422 domain-containing protein n=1 Tax=unclassified Bifidobacterium TaxID=2608897 RepID=UPI0011274086|nr:MULTISPECIES: DUF4422 domain-containing protein [unclassified Bifidobacterium]TPF85532.1 glycosyltransferase [Bifidobacterium sp. UTCIF-37]TPF87593.1 glycosyltransferase [Bifidobacterium sp. UTCIF-38]
MALTAQSSKPQQPARIKLFVSAHKPAAVPDGASIVPIQVGAANAPRLFEDMLHDDEGENISEKNPMYCELTAQYWAWKNADADYYGFCHYRRYFDFTELEHQQNDYGEIMDGYIDDLAIAEYGLDDYSIAREVNGWDVITSPLNDVRAFGGFANLKDHWDGDAHLHLKDLRHMYDILCARHPEYREDADAVLNGHKACFCNMFIMRKAIFNEYCEWLFPLLDEFTEEWDHSLADVQTLRTPGHLAERLLNIFIAHHQRVSGPEHGWRIKQLQCVHFTHPEPVGSLEPLDRNPRDVVPVIFAADDNYVPMLTTTIYSMLANANPERFYDVIVLERDISEQNKQNITQFLAEFPNAEIRFYDVSRAMAGYELTTSNAHISVETYYRFIIQDALPFYSKILYLDSDLVVNADIAELYDTPLGDCALGAVRDLDFLGNLNMKDGKRLEYVDSKLHMKQPFDYFQAGVLVMNLDRMRDIHTVPEWLDIASRPGFIYNDQDILNMECEGDVTYLPYDWNVMHDCAGRVHGVFDFAPAAVYQAYLESRKHPKIVHYAGFDKPWKNPWCDFGPLYWSYARKTPFSLQTMAVLADVKRPKPAVHHERAIAEDSPIRKYADAIAPSGSKQRELLKVVARKLQGKK